jgi:hypothetical protein
MGTNSNYALRMPTSLKEGVAKFARDDGTTLNQFIVSAVAEKLAVLQTATYFAERAVKGDIDRALAFLDHNRSFHAPLSPSPRHHRRLTPRDVELPG